MDYLGYLNLVSYKVSRPIKCMPYFILGVMFSDMENMVDRPLDRIRNLPWPLKYLFNTILLTFIAIWGGQVHDNPKGCMTLYDDRCWLHEMASINGFLPLRFTLNISAISAIVIALTSPVCQWVLSSAIMQFLG